ncbi:hypothetical protein SprV_0401471100 [Sparganum proliferum]
MAEYTTWFPQVSRWLQESQREFSRDLALLYNGLFELEPLESFGLIPGQPVFEGIRHRMHRLSEDLDKHLGAAQEPSGEVMQVDDAGAVVGQPNVAAEEFGFLKDAYEVGPDGRLMFKARFNTKGFEAGDINVSTDENKLVVHAKRTETKDGATCSREYCRSVFLPEAVQRKDFKANLTTDGVLILEAPVKQPDYNAITFDANRKLCVHPKSPSPEGKTTGKELVATGKSGLTVAEDGKGGKKVHLEVDVGPQYSPNDVSVRMDANRIVVTGSRDNKYSHATTTGTFEGSESEHFSKAFSLPQTIDSCSVEALLKDGKLILEAPLCRL